MKIRQRLVIDTNALVSGFIFARSTPRRAVRRVVEDEQLLVSEATMLELVDVIGRPKFGQADRLANFDFHRSTVLSCGSVGQCETSLAGAVTESYSNSGHFRLS